MKLCRVAIVTLSISALLSPVLALAGALDRGPMQQRYNPAAEEMIRIPGVVGMYEQDALAVLQQAGVAPEIRYDKRYNEDLAGKEGTVIEQEPGAAGVSMLGSIVTITVYWPASMGVEPGGSGNDGQYSGDEGGQWGEPADAAPPAYQEPAPQWGGASQPADSGWTPPPAPASQPALGPVPRAEPAPAPTGTPIQEQLDNKVPARVDIREKIKGAERKLAPSKGIAAGGGGLTGQPVNPTVPPAKPATGQKSSGPAPVSAKPVRQTVTPVNPQPSGTTSFTASPVQPTATQAEQQPPPATTFNATAVPQTATAVVSNVAPTSGRVQIKIIKFEAIKDTGDPKKDGKKDEIMIAARGVLYRVSDGSVLRDIKFKSRVYGDIKDHPERVKAGSARSSGGIRDGDSVITDITIFDQIMGPDQSLTLVPFIWEIDENPIYLDEFFHLPTSYYPQSLPDVIQGSGPFRDRYCRKPWDAGPAGDLSGTRIFMSLTKESSLPTIPMESITDNYSLPVSLTSYVKHKKNRGFVRFTSLHGQKFSLDWSHLEKISQINCDGYGPGVLKLNFTRNVGRPPKNKGEYNMYLRFITTPATGSN